MIPAPRDLDAPIAVLVPELAHHLGVPRTVVLACDLLEGADATAYPAELPYLTGFVPDLNRWPSYWPQVWGARALLYVWEESVAPTVVAGLADPAWRVAEMCLKVCTAHEIADGADRAVELAGHELSRVRGQALRLLGTAGESEHVGAVRDRLTDPDEAVRRHAARALERLEQRLDLP